MQKPRPTGKNQSGNTRERLLNEACRIFAECGYRDTRIQEICSAANANIAAVNYHFGGKEGLYKAVWDRALEHAVAEDAAVAGPLSADADREWLYEYVRACVRSVFDTGTGGFLRRLMANEAINPSPISEEVLAEHLAPRRTELATRLRRLLGPDATPWQIGCCVFAIHSQFTALALNRAARRAIFRNDAPSDEEAEHFVREICAFTMGGIRALRGVPRRAKAQVAAQAAAEPPPMSAAAAARSGGRTAASLALALFLAAASFGAPADPVTAAERTSSPIEALRLAEASRTVSSDGSVAVAGEAFSSADRAVILGFVADFRSALESELFGASNPGGGQDSFRTDDYRILVRSVAPDAEQATLTPSLLPRVSGEPPHTTLVISATGPVSKLDPHALGEEIADGLLRLRVLAAARDAAAAGAPAATAIRPQPVPRWFSRGLARLSDRSLRQADYDAVAAKFAAGDLTSLGALVAEDSEAASGDPALAAQLTAFWLSFPDRPARVRAMVGALSKGIPWSPSLFLLTSTGSDSEERGAESFKTFMAERGRRVLTPGASTADGAALLLASLELVPGRDGVPANAGEGGSTGAMPPTALFLPENASWSRQVAATRERRVRAAAPGRGAAWADACGAIADLFAAASAGRPPADAEARYAAAASALEAAATQGANQSTNPEQQ